MAKNSIRDYDATSGNNTDVQSVDISEGCAASGINNALREIMTDLKNVSTGAVALETPAADQLNVDNIRIDGNTISSTDTNGNVNIDPAGTGAVVVAQVASSSLDIEGDRTDSQITLKGGSAGAGIQLFGSTYTNYAGAMFLDATASTTGTNDAQMVFRTGSSPSEAMRIDRSGALLVGKTSNDSTTVGANIRADKSFITSSGQEALVLNRNTSDGTILEFRKANGAVGSIGVSDSDNFFIDCQTSSHSGLTFATANITPRLNGSQNDGNVDLGAGSARFLNIYATNATIQTSDQNEKEQIASLTTAEMTAAKAISKLFKTFKWQHRVSEEGDAARTHAGVIAQEVQTAMTDAGLDASNYAFWCSDTWWETSTEVAAVEADEEAGIEAQDAYIRIDTYHTADEAPDGATQRTRLGIRYPELLAFVGAATEQRLGDIETRLTALENA
jgi:hypothetical protein